MIAYTSPFIPAEWIAAHGLQPFRLRPSREGSALQGQCPFARAYVQELQTGAFRAAIFATTCDQMRRAPESLSRPDLPVFVMNVPATWQSPAAGRMYVDELRRLGRFLQSVGGRAVEASGLAEIMLEYHRARQRLADGSPRLTARAYQQAVMDMCQCPPSGLASWSPPPGDAPAGGVPIAVVGGRLSQASLELLDLIEQAGGRVVLDATETGLRGLPVEPDLRQLADDPVTELAAMYFGGMPDAFRRPNSRLYEWLSREFAQRRPRGLVLIHPVWCDLWHAEAPRLREWSGLSLLHLTDAGTASARGSMATRIQSFMEVLR
jgi:benzoyl-CoA reductase/2-hydroxyglutaryl-CoA dehydratase subunit BcrC/BadD/HgdB